MALEPQIGEFEETFSVKVDMDAIMKEVYEIIDKHMHIVEPKKEQPLLDPPHKVELHIDPELRSDLGGLARYVAAEIEQEDCALRERIWHTMQETTETAGLKDFYGLCDYAFNYIKTGKHE